MNMLVLVVFCSAFCPLYWELILQKTVFWGRITIFPEEQIIEGRA
jgi:hypothetical protein